MAAGNQAGRTGHDEFMSMREKQDCDENKQPKKLQLRIVLQACFS
jgi:hypothetical protein